ncbi:MAG: hypothetical protein GY794_20600, partial [bacterium]|nr:hypothetical protein [bacterium]
MQWIRENLFLTCIAGALVVCLGVCYFIKSGQVAGYTNEDMKPRKALARKLTGLSRKKPVNKDRMKKAKARLDEIRQERDEAASNVDVWNKKNYQVLELKATVGGQTKVYQAFPHDSELYQKYGLTSKFTNAYRIELYGALAELDLTSRATNTEIEALSATINKNIQSGRTVALRNVEHARRRSGKPKGKDRSDGGEQEETKPDGVSD